MADSDKPLAFKEFTSGLQLGQVDGIRLYEENSNISVPLNVENYKHFGRPFMRKGLPLLQWGARTDAKSISGIAELHCFHSGLLISSRIRAVIEAYDSLNLEFIPLKIWQRNTETLLADDWWFCNVYNWKDAFDFGSSDFDSEDFLELEDGYCGSLRLAQQFGPKLITSVRKLSVLPQALEGGLFLARAPMLRICTRVFVGRELGHEIVLKVNETAPRESFVELEEFNPAAPRRIIRFPKM